MKRYIIVLIILFSCVSVNAQLWIYSLPKPTKTYTYEIAEAVGKTEEEALQKSLAKVIYNKSISMGINIQTDSVLSVLKKGGNLVFDNITFGIPIKRVCYKSSRAISVRGYKVKALYQVAREAHKDPKFKDFDCARGKEIRWKKKD
ncbi:MAG: hypothetical protein ACEPOV_13645 [Hyphomicrobiales bacterium]